jgi:predicted HTH domain antitoxin
MKSLTIAIPDSINEMDLKLHIAALLFEKGLLSSGQAADLAGVTKRYFIENAGKYGVSVFGETEEDIKAMLNA